ncbi:MAG: class I SAM-dependent methyltransferase [Pseudomonadota bacterium]
MHIIRRLALATSSPPVATRSEQKPKPVPDLQQDDETIPVCAQWFGSWHFSVRRRAFSSDELGGVYDNEADVWDARLERLGVADAYQTLLRKLIAGDHPATGARTMRVLDAGIGTGALSLALGEVMPRPMRVAGIDLSDRMLDRTGRHLSRAGIDHVLQRANITELPFEDGVFDIAMTAHVLEHLPDPRAALREMVRVLKPGGLLIACMTRRSSLGAYVQWKWHTHQVSPAQGKRWLRECGLQAVCAVPFEKGTACRKMSIAFTGRRPIDNVTLPNEARKWN